MTRTGSSTTHERRSRRGLAAWLAVAAWLGLVPGLGRAPQATASDGEGVLSLATCGWPGRSNASTGNVLYPDKDAVYYLAALPTPPPGFRYRIRGEFAHARYISFISYNGLPVDALLDTDIVSDPGSENPFVPGADRTAAARAYTVPIVAEAPPGDPAERSPGALYIGAGQHGSPTPIPYLFYRIYVADDGTDAKGGVELPVIEVVLDGGTGRGDLAALPCGGLQDARPDADVIQEILTDRGEGPGSPLPARGSTNPPTWQVQSGLTAAVLAGAGQGDLVSGGPASNPHNNYIQTNLSRSFGDVVVIHAQAPNAPRTRDGEPIMGSGDLRYWSICQNSRTTRYIDCLSDEDVVVDPDGTFTVVVSTPENRPANADNWILYGVEPETTLLYRHMLPSPAFFPHSAQGVAASGLAIENAMGEYFPRTVYCSKQEFEWDRCGL